MFTKLHIGGFRSKLQLMQAYRTACEFQTANHCVFPFTIHWSCIICDSKIVFVFIFCLFVIVYTAAHLLLSARRNTTVKDNAYHHQPKPRPITSLSSISVSRLNTSWLARSRPARDVRGRHESKMTRRTLKSNVIPINWRLYLRTCTYLRTCRAYMHATDASIGLNAIAYNVHDSVKRRTTGTR